MTNELQLVLEKNIEELTPKLIAFNNAQLLSAVEERLKTYEGVEYTDKQIGEAKKDRAELNAFCIALNSERINIGKIYLQPYENFKKQVDEVIGRVKTAVLKIDNRVKAYEEKQRQIKYNEIETYFNSVIGDFKDVISLDKILQAKWLNASVYMTTIKKEIDQVIQNMNNALIAIEALGSPDEAFVKAYYFKTLDLSAALTENAKLQKAREDAEKLKAIKEEKKSVSTVEPQTVLAMEVNQIATPNPEVRVIKFAVETTLDKLQKLKAFLIENEINYKAI